MKSAVPHGIVDKYQMSGKKSILVTLYKKGDAMECGNYRTIALTSLMGKVLMVILNDRLGNQTEEHLADEQAGFRRDRSTVQQILALRLIAEEARRKDKKIYNCFVDFQKAFDSINQNITWAVLRSYGVDGKLIRLLQDANSKALAVVRIGGEIGPWFSISRGTRQGDPSSPRVFITHLERAMDRVKQKDEGVSIHGMWINNLRFADDIDLIEENEQRLERTVQILNEDGKRYGLQMNFEKTKRMVFGGKYIVNKIIVEGIKLDNVEKFTYLGCNMTFDLDCKKEIVVMLSKATAILNYMDKIWRSKDISISVKVNILKTSVFSSALYGCGAWVLHKETERRILAFERKCYRKILQITWLQKIRNEEVYNRIPEKENLMQKVIQRKLRLFGHICRMSDDRKIKSLVFGIMDGESRVGRPHKEWVDDITDWCGGTLQDLYHIAQDRWQWSKMVGVASDTYGR